MHLLPEITIDPQCFVPQKLQQQLDLCRPVLQDLAEYGTTLSSLSPGEGASKLDDLIRKDNKKFDTINDQVQKRAERIMLQRKKSVEVSERRGSIQGGLRKHKVIARMVKHIHMYMCLLVWLIIHLYM